MNRQDLRKAYTRLQEAKGPIARPIVLIPDRLVREVKKTKSVRRRASANITGTSCRATCKWSNASVISASASCFRTWFVPRQDPLTSVAVVDSVTKHV